MDTIIESWALLLLPLLAKKQVTTRIVGFQTKSEVLAQHQHPQTLPVVIYTFHQGLGESSLQAKHLSLAKQDQLKHSSCK
jgi:hypothetical protein